MRYEWDFVQTNKTLASKLNKPNANKIKTIDTNLVLSQSVFQNMFLFYLPFVSVDPTVLILSVPLHKFGYKIFKQRQRQRK